MGSDDTTDVGDGETAGTATWLDEEVRVVGLMGFGGGCFLVTVTVEDERCGTWGLVAGDFVLARTVAARIGDESALVRDLDVPRGVGGVGRRRASISVSRLTCPEGTSRSPSQAGGIILLTVLDGGGTGFLLGALLLVGGGFAWY